MQTTASSAAVYNKKSQLCFEGRNLALDEIEKEEALLFEHIISDEGTLLTEFL